MYAMESCLRASPIVELILQSDPTFQAARQCRNRRHDLVAASAQRVRAVARVTSPQQVQAAVLCAVGAGARISVRAGAHGFTGDACTGDIILDVAGLDDFSVDPATRLATFGAGHTHSQLYSKLNDAGLVLPGGTENSVGTAGLWLGCGRGLFAQWLGLSCDSMRAIEFVDTHGRLRTANAEQDADMFWLARGGGGEFPGVLTSITAAATDAPAIIHMRSYSYPLRGLSSVFRAWAEHSEGITPDRRSERPSSPP
jgi:FAD/FMN-containing dehydrogenase